MKNRPERFSWAGSPVRPLGEYSKAPGGPGFYEIGPKRGERFKPLYGGCSSNLKKRLKTHATRSHNGRIRNSPDPLFYRCKALPSSAYAKLVEAHYIAAFDYPWNRRNEWKNFFQKV